MRLVRFAPLAVALTLPLLTSFGAAGMNQLQPALRAQPAPDALSGQVVDVRGAGIELLRRGMTSFVLLEAADDLGGTWRDNRYPGIAVDIPSVSYCFSYETDFPWSRVFSPGEEVQRYIRHCVKKYGIGPHIRYRARVIRSQFNSATDTWATTLQDGSVISSRYLISATGQFGAPKVPSIPGLDTFGGRVGLPLRRTTHFAVRHGFSCACPRRNPDVNMHDRGIDGNPGPPMPSQTV